MMISKAKEKQLQGFKRCSNCNTIKKHEDFNKNVCQKDGLQSLCRSCQSIRAKEIRLKVRLLKPKRLIAEDGHKICVICKIRKPLEEFYNDKYSKYGKHSYCKPCKLEDNRKYLPPLKPPQPKAKSGYKICSGCKVEKLLEEFHNNKHFKDGKCSYCKPCRAKANNKYLKKPKPYVPPIPKPEKPPIHIPPKPPKPKPLKTKKCLSCKKDVDIKMFGKEDIVCNSCKVQTEVVTHGLKQKEQDLVRAFLKARNAK